MNGGYRIASFKNYPLTSGEQKSIEGMFKTVQNPYKKSILIEGLTVGNIEYPAFFAVFLADSANYVSRSVIGSNAVTIEVTPDDNVTVTVGANRTTASATKTAK